MTDIARPRTAGTARRRAGSATVAGLSLLLLTGCSTDWASMSPGLQERVAAEAAADEARVTTAGLPADGTAAVAAAGTGSGTGSGTAVTAAAPAREPGDLDTGSATHRVAAGDVTVVIDYWTTQDPAAWTPERATAVHLSAHLEGAGDRTEVLVSRFSAVLDDGTRRTALAEDRGEFAISAPYSYGGVVTVPGLAPGTERAELAVQLDLLVETEPGSGSHYRQTVLDTLQLTFDSEVAP